MAFRKVIEETGLGIDACADVLGVDRKLFQQWADYQKEIPPAYSMLLAVTLGVKAEALTSRFHSSPASSSSSKIEPAAIWFKFRGEQFTSADRESILAIRRLGHNANELEQATLGQPNKAWDVIFQTILRQVDLQASPQEQGRAAARHFSELNQFGHAGRSSSEILRDRLRSKGILLIESPLPNSQIEGCTFYVGDSSAQRPCVFVNTYKTTWFRRNVIIMHELCHAMFDQTAGGQIDVLTEAPELLPPSESLVEVRADVFARETLLPSKLLVSLLKQSGLNPQSLTPAGLAHLVAESGVEKKAVIRVILENSLIDEVLAQQYLSYDIAESLREMTDHALSTAEYIQKIGLKAASAWTGKRLTTVAKTNLLLPVPYIKTVIDAVRTFSVSISRAAELLMIDEATFHGRFGDLIAEVAE
jgi:Zn-dependent peptidase ImmA (M78 family)